MDEKEISISAEGVTLKGEIVDDVRAPIKRLSKTADSILRLACNIISTPADYVSANIESFRNRYRSKFDEIPAELRQEPPMRISCAVLQHVSYSADEPDIQELFAKLLASASNAEKAKRVHPGFVTVISELRAIDAHVLIAKSRNEHLSIEGSDGESVQQAISNLIRLGLLDWKVPKYNDGELRRLAESRNHSIFIDEDKALKVLVDTVNDVRQLKVKLIEILKKQSQRNELQITSFGWSFISAVLE